MSAMQDLLSWPFFKNLFSQPNTPPAEVPKYWTRASTKESSSLSDISDVDDDNFVPVEQEDRKLLESLMNRTSKEPEVEFRLNRAIRVENPALWQRYQDFVSQLKRTRGTCQYEGRGPPMTQAALQGVELSDGFPQPLDENLCEAYLWHATKPHIAAKILREGFKVSERSAFGKRFGRGAYFCEDAAKADAYSSSGEGIYKDSYALLLCRVALGRQLHTKLFRQERAAQEAGRSFDSILAEPRGASYREFVALQDMQIYPEFALVYERQPLGTSAGLGSNIRRCVSHNFPLYWESACSGSDHFKMTHPDQEMEHCVQQLMDRTWIKAFTRSRLTSRGDVMDKDDPNHDMPEGISVMKVLRLEDAEMWNAYRAKRHLVRFMRPGLQVISPAQLGVRTVLPDLPLVARAALDQGVAEVFLWHGCAPQEAMDILQNGFPQNPGRGGSGRCEGQFGEGYYFVDSASKADEHSRDDKEGFYSGSYAVLLCRVVLGRTGVLQQPDRQAHLQLGQDKPFDSIMGIQEATKGRFTEYVVSDRTQIYPEYAIIYERKYVTPRVR